MFKLTDLASQASKIKLAELITYVEKEGWSRQEAFGNVAFVYGAMNKPELILPKTKQVEDYASVILETAEILAKYRNISLSRVLDEIAETDSDVIRINVKSDEDNTIGIKSAEELIENSKSLVLSAACSVVQPQLSYRAGRNIEANNYLEKVRIAQTEVGSFVLKLLSPVPPLVKSSQLGLFGDEVTEAEDPFERKVTEKLMTALDNAREFAEAVVRNDIVEFDKLVEKGLSVNLLNAAGRLAQINGGAKVTTSWSGLRPRRENSVSVYLSEDDAPVFKEAARVLRERAPKLDEYVIGTVNLLKREPDSETGEIAVQADIDGKLQSVRVKLDGKDYEEALHAHEQRLYVELKGDLKRSGQRWQMSPRSFKTIVVDE